MIYGLGRRLHLLRDSSVIPVFPGEMNLKTRVHADPVLQTVSCTDAGSEKSCRSFSFIHPNSCFIFFNTKFYPRLSQQLIKWSKKKFHTSSWPWRNTLMISLRTDVTDRWINERKEIAFAKCLHVPGIRCISTYLILKTIHRDAITLILYIKNIRSDIWGQKETRLWVMSTQCNIKMMYYNVHLKVR